MPCFCPPFSNCVPPIYFSPSKPTPPANEDIFPPAPFRETTSPSQVQSKEGNGDYEWDSDFLLFGIACICVAFLLIVSIIYLYSRCRANRQRQREVDRRGLQRLGISRSRVSSMRPAEDRVLASPREGPRRSMVDALPVFVYQPENFRDGLRCAVCLCEFGAEEKAKLLPSCKHSFHVDCIDMWFYSHSTCPLCRARVDAQPADVEMRAVNVEMRVIEEEEQEEKDDKVFISSTSGCETKEGHIENKSGDCCQEEERGGHTVIDMPNTQN